jgi:hypothetical protein
MTHALSHLEFVFIFGGKTNKPKGYTRIRIPLAKLLISGHNSSSSCLLAIVLKILQ